MKDIMPRFFAKEEMEENVFGSGVISAFCGKSIQDKLEEYRRV